MTTQVALEVFDDAIEACKDIFNDFSEYEVYTMAPSITRAWEVGKSLDGEEEPRL